MTRLETSNRRGERIGWVGGWLGGFGWIAGLAFVFAVRGQIPEAVSGLLIFVLGGLLIFRLAPWHQPMTPYWRLFIPLYLVLIAGIGWTLWAFGAEETKQLNWWQIFMLAPLFGPFLTIGRRRWRDGEPPA